jgi:hypothetical protein
VRGGGQKERANEGEYGGWMYLVFIYENRRMKSAEIILRGGGERG